MPAVSTRYRPFHAERQQVETDPDQYASTASSVMPLLDFLPRPGHPFHVESVMVRSGEVSLIAASISDTRMEQQGEPSRATLRIPFRGSSCYRIDRRQLINRAGETALYLPGKPYRCETDGLSGLVIGFDPQRLASGAAVMARAPEVQESYLERFQQPLLLDRHDRLVAHLLATIDRVVALIDLESRRSLDLPPTVPVGRLLEQAVALLLCPELAQL